MTIDRQSTLPPRWAESLLRLLLPPKDRESVSGDLLEEYRESIVPAVGAGARRWYVRQVAWYVLRASWAWGLIAIAILAIPRLVEIAALRSVMPYALVATYALAAFWNTWRSGHLRSGMIVGFVAAASSGMLSSARATIMLAIWHDPQTMQTIRNTGGLNELLWGIPLELILIGAICGTAGAVLAKTLRWPLVRAKVAA